MLKTSLKGILFVRKNMIQNYSCKKNHEVCCVCIYQCLSSRITAHIKGEERVGEAVVLSGQHNAQQTTVLWHPV